jgi:gamma-glutamyltranspeptidase/glutathione hydrolase
VVNRDLASTLRLIAKQRRRVFYEGEIAEAIVEDMRRHDGLIAARTCAPGRRAATSRSGARIAATRVEQSPPGGGVMLIEMLNILEHFDLASLEHNSAEYCASSARR